MFASPHANNSHLIIPRLLAPGRLRPGLELSSAIISENRQLPSASAANDQIIVSIPIQIAPGNRWTKLAEFLRQELLAGKIIVISLHMLVIKESADLLKQGCGRRCRGGRPRVSWSRARFVNFIN